ncbi:hypothetical protein [Streptomyces globisporus]|uniref:hypothetical protein n=1 Tax=Streptomyces globisporus TaxID=1908 RepID=UPI0037BBAD1D
MEVDVMVLGQGVKACIFTKAAHMTAAARWPGWFDGWMVWRSAAHVRVREVSGVFVVQACGEFDADEVDLLLAAWEEAVTSNASIVPDTARSSRTFGWSGPASTSWRPEARCRERAIRRAPRNELSPRNDPAHAPSG